MVEEVVVSVWELRGGRGWRGYRLVRSRHMADGGGGSWGWRGTAAAGMAAAGGRGGGVGLELFGRGRERSSKVVQHSFVLELVACTTATTTTTR